MKENTLVIIHGEIENRVRETTDELIIGTVVWCATGQVCVIYDDGMLWTGPTNQVSKYVAEEQE